MRVNALIASALTAVVVLGINYASADSLEPNAIKNETVQNAAQELPQQVNEDTQSPDISQATDSEEPTNYDEKIAELEKKISALEARPVETKETVVSKDDHADIWKAIHSLEESSTVFGDNIESLFYNQAITDADVWGIMNMPSSYIPGIMLGAYGEDTGTAQE